ncbi:dual specificity protein kinase pyk3-like isoform X2 [Drosophila innubila]|uniref:dual specificity protein kinase pyk3-like isoform X2 n=1 Tax=Drosophila innubila TaxID=198719 RepID=UPI00148D9DB0|nr:dual specificity protein kinase pyk3-like isoform X2 [Drosophila innubila]
MEIGFGSFADVYSAIYPTKFGDKRIAVKKLRHSPESIKKLERELISLSRLEHPNIVTLYGISINYENKYCILLEYAECGSLYHFLHSGKHEETTVSDIHKLFWMLQCAKGIAYLHEKHIVHRDLKAANILLYNNFHTLKLWDFGIVKEIASNNKADAVTANYMAPEVAIRGNYDTKCDVYSYGILFWEVMSGKKPFYNFGDIAPLVILHKVMQGNRPIMSDVQGSENLDWIKELINHCWHAESKKRPTIQQVLKILESFEFEKSLPNMEISETYDSVDGEHLTFNRVHWQDILLDKQTIGIGKFGDVYKAKWKTTDGEKTIAVKRYGIPGNGYIQLEREFKYLSRLNHDNIITLYGMSVDNDKRVFLLREYADCGSLEDVLHGNEGNTKYSYFEALKWMHQCVKGMAYMHEHNITHRDLKPTKLLFVDDFQKLKICSSISVPEVITGMTNGFGSAPYMAPEVITVSQYTAKGNVYSFGIILWEVMSRRRPFSSLDSPMKIISEACKGKRPDLNDANIFMHSNPIKDLIIKCWDSDPHKRPTMKDIISSLVKILLSA